MAYPGFKFKRTLAIPLEEEDLKDVPFHLKGWFGHCPLCVWDINRNCPSSYFISTSTIYEQ
jgi:hypothetical protein